MNGIQVLPDVKATVEVSYHHQIGFGTLHVATITVERDGKTATVRMGPRFFIYYLLRDAAHTCLDSGVAEDSIFWKDENGESNLVAQLDKWDRENPNDEGSWRSPPWKQEGTIRALPVEKLRELGILSNAHLGVND